MPPRSAAATSPPLRRVGILTAGVAARGAVQLAAFLVAYFGAIPSLVTAVVHPYDEAATPEAIGSAVFWCLLLLACLAAAMVMGRFARYMHEWWLGEVATRVAENYDVPWQLIDKATRYKPIAKPYWPSPNRVLRLSDRRGWISGEATIEILVPARPGRPIVVAISQPRRAASE
ncbi:hypothetical protein ACFCVO_19505 [Agromyces sp. NPDC056379]|uniref:hypothetical protein n=1 Tax=unclassified Agromyces TaxID=2639701 RepID=UPI0035DB7C25